MWYLAKSTTKNEQENSGDIIVLLSEIKTLDLRKKDDEEIYVLKISLENGHFYETHDSLEVAKNNILTILNKIGGNLEENKNIVDNFDIFAGKENNNNDKAKKAFLKSLLS
ncbi:MAG TPA: hypothetical protein VK622_07455 [Puia sp.]|nr:hypothetical protein [Puia sp.]